MEVSHIRARELLRKVLRAPFEEYRGTTRITNHVTRWHHLLANEYPLWSCQPLAYVAIQRTRLPTTYPLRTIVESLLIDEGMSTTQSDPLDPLPAMLDRRRSVLSGGYSGRKTSPPEEIVVQCAKCQHQYTKLSRRRINLVVDDYDSEDVEELKDLTCPQCGYRQELKIELLYPPARMIMIRETLRAAFDSASLSPAQGTFYERRRPHIDFDQLSTGDKSTQVEYAKEFVETVAKLEDVVDARRYAADKQAKDAAKEALERFLDETRLRLGRGEGRNLPPGHILVPLFTQLSRLLRLCWEAVPADEVSPAAKETFAAQGVTDVEGMRLWAMRLALPVLSEPEIEALARQTTEAKSFGGGDVLPPDPDEFALQMLAHRLRAYSGNTKKRSLAHSLCRVIRPRGACDNLRDRDCPICDNWHAAPRSFWRRRRR